MASSSASDSPLLPDEVTIMRLVDTRRNEIKSLLVECQKKLPKLNSQRLPRYMRRRAASTNPKRLPKSCRTPFLEPLTGSKAAKNSEMKERKKKQMKKHVHSDKIKASRERRELKIDSRSLLHIWFAKRFKMSSDPDFCDNFKVPLFNATKNQRNLFRMAKIGLCYFYLTPTLKCFFLDYNDESMYQKVASKFNNHLQNGQIFPKIDSELSHTQLFLYESKDGPIVAPIEIINVPRTKSLVFWVPRFVQSKFSELFKLDGINFDTNTFEIIRIVGTQSFKAVNFALQSNLSDSESDVFEVVNEESDLKVSTIVIKGSLNEDRPFVDMIIPRSETKDVWKKLVTNKAHLVGGFRDLDVLHFNSSRTHFPNLGFPDCKFSKLFEVWKQFLPEKNFFVVRDQKVLERIKTQKLEIIKKLISENDLSSSALITVEIISRSRGTPEAKDIICLPSDNDLELLPQIDDFESQKTEESNFSKIRKCDSISDVQKLSSREIIGLVDFGQFCLERGRGCGLGQITLSGLIKILSADKNKMDSRNEIICLFRNQRSSCFRFCNLKIL